MGPSGKTRSVLISTREKSVLRNLDFTIDHLCLIASMHDPIIGHQMAQDVLPGACPLRCVSALSAEFRDFLAFF